MITLNAEHLARQRAVNAIGRPDEGLVANGRKVPGGRRDSGEGLDDGHVREARLLRVGELRRKHGLLDEHLEKK